MANDNETVKQVCEKNLRNILDPFGKRVCIFDDIADEIEAAHNREIAAKDDARMTVVSNYENVICAKDRTIESLRALVKELADTLDEYFDDDRIRMLVAKAREVVK